ncbi:hypothetical protein BCR37DRAFT_384145 [Protomyces lactucae-debilis]|uniref:Uncharacterized protein n=1 Tax=Protomyces lactucae-debilis TaxID=2754530 RepID=A0A1Y2EU47_PROLT|nr:uncharacterized protein BCR37DRAFT_384145 [Protomyces lactucae-debilis]ORY75093.1 hypothetical protein BCR37DRAFT_384145 [Protomyces lactucae-debilis]
MGFTYFLVAVFVIHGLTAISASVSCGYDAEAIALTKDAEVQYPTNDPMADKSNFVEKKTILLQQNRCTVLFADYSMVERASGNPRYLKQLPCSEVHEMSLHCFPVLVNHKTNILVSEFPEALVKLKAGNLSAFLFCGQNRRPPQETGEYFLPRSPVMAFAALQYGEVTQGKGFFVTCWYHSQSLKQNNIWFGTDKVEATCKKRPCA